MSDELKAEVLAGKWWDAAGRFIDPDTDDVSWYDKREELAKLAFIAGMKALMDGPIAQMRSELPHADICKRMAGSDCAGPPHCYHADRLAAFDARFGLEWK